jgi:biotin operon repressor
MTQNPSLGQPHLKPSAARALARLRQANGAWISGNALAEVSGWRFGGRIHELRQMGYTIERRSSKRSAVDEYRLVEQPEQLRIAL